MARLGRVSKPFVVSKPFSQLDQSRATSPARNRALALQGLHWCARTLTAGIVDAAPEARC